MSIILPENSIISKLRESIEQESLFLIGGSVRDLFLKREILDYDFLLEGDIFSYVSRLNEKIYGKVVLNKRLMTASVKIKNLMIDFAAARQEYYREPGDLPLVSPTCWQEDLKRRDFTINTLAVQLQKEGWGELIDLWGGRKDLQGGLIRILHEDSFRDDPTRILRAIRYKNRLGFIIEEATLGKLLKSWGYLERVSPRRRLKEWQVLCQEETVWPNIQDIYLLGGWTSFMSSISYKQEIWAEQGLSLDGENIPQGLRPWFYYLLILLVKEPDKLEDLAAYWGLYPLEKESLQQALDFIKDQQQREDLKWRQFISSLKALPLEASYYLFRQNPEWGDNWETFRQEILNYKMPIQGGDLLALGIKPGPEVGKFLQRLADYYQQNFFNSKKEGIELAIRLLKEENR